MNWINPGLAKAAIESPVLDPQLLKAFLLLYVQLLVVTSVALFFSTFSGPMLSAAFTFGLYIVGHFNSDLANFEAVVKSPVAGWLGKALYYLLPNLAPFDVKAAVVHGQPVSAMYVALTAGYGLLYATAMITIAVIVFSRRDFK
jgi:Cu-processing system permease protein